MLNQLQNNPFFHAKFLDNLISDWITAFVIFFISLVILKFCKKLLIARLKKISQKTETKLDNIIVSYIGNINWNFFILISVYISTTFLKLNSFIENFIYYTFLVFITYYAIKILQELLEFGTEIIIQKKIKGDDDNIAIVRIISKIAKISLWVGAVLLILTNLGYNINSLVAGLGIGGIAVALALQNILSDIFSSFSIFFDKPFRVGDFIVVGEYKGTVKKIGMKTTRIQSLQGEELIISNNELTKAKLQNYGVMEKRRISFNINIDQETPVYKLKKIPNFLKKIISSQKNVEIDRVYFTEISEDHFVYSIVYYVNSKEYEVYLKAQQNINLEIMDKFTKEKINLSHPTQTVYVKK